MSTSSTTAIFDLPPVVDTICRFLDSWDCVNASLVNKTFHSSCRRYIWKTLTFKDTHDNSAISEEHQKVLLANSHWIQDLFVSRIHTPLVCLTDPSSSCRNLDYLECDLEHEASLYAASLAKLLTLNTSLRNLSIKSLDDDPQNNDEDRPLNIDGVKQVVSALPYLTSLQYVSVETAGRFGPMDLALFLAHLPPSVMSFTFNEYYPQDSGMEEPFHFLSEHTLCWPGVYPDMVDLTFGEFDQYNLTMLILPLLRRCPRLERLSLPIIPGFDLPYIAEALRVSCPNLQILTISGVLEEDDLLPMVDAIPALTGLDLPIDVPTTAVFIPRVIEKWSNTLTELTFGAGAIIQSSDIQLLLTSCPHLEIFWMIPYGAQKRPWIVTNYYSPLLLSDLAQSEWTCLGLTALYIFFHDERVEQDTLEQHLEQEERTQALIKKAYAQLGKLKKLETLHLGWGQPFREGEDGDSLAIHKPGPLVHMDFSMASGLPLMKGISSLSKLSISGMARVSVGNEEMKWIQQTWPYVEIEGLDQNTVDGLPAQMSRLSVQGQAP